MIVYRSIAEWKALRPRLPVSLGLVPTMGAFHEGHLALVRRARAETEVVVVWIFVNPKQFTESSDFEGYPRDLERDLGLLEDLGVDYVLAPEVEEVYPPAFQTTVHVERVARRLEGGFRPGHFEGVATVCAKMFCLTRPTRAYFGQKDGQQTVVIRRMVADLGMLMEVVVCPTVREPDGLAMSSRNVHLEPRQRQAAGVLYRALQAARGAFAEGERDAGALRRLMREQVAAEPLAQLDYASVSDPDTLEELDTLVPQPDRPAGLALIAARFGAIRLIDNLFLGHDPTAA